MTAPNRITAPHGARSMGLQWPDGLSAEIPHSVLRGYCPCAGCQGHSGPIRFIPVTEGPALEVLNIEGVGNYAVRLKWGDHHQAGIYSFVYLRLLADLQNEHGAELPQRLPTLDRRGA